MKNNKYRQQRRQPEPPVDPISDLHERILKFCSRVDRYVAPIDASTSDHVVGLLRTSAFILATLTLESEDPDEDSDEESDPSYNDYDGDGDDEDDPDTAPAPAPAPSPPPRNLRKQWAGDLPGAPERPSEPLKHVNDPIDYRSLVKPLTERHRPSGRPRVSKRPKLDVSRLKANGISGKAIDDFEVTYDIPPSSHCSMCMASVLDHPVDRNLPEQNGLVARILCSGDRAYLPRGQFNE